MPRSLTRRSLPRDGQFVRALSRLGIAVVLTASLLGLAAPPAQAATTRTTTRSCMDAGGITWHTKVVWGNTYVSSGVTKVVVDSASWTTTLGSVPTDSEVRTYDGSGRLAKKATRTNTLDYRQGSCRGRAQPHRPTVGGRRGRDQAGPRRRRLRRLHRRRSAVRHRRPGRCGRGRHGVRDGSQRDGQDLPAEGGLRLDHRRAAGGAPRPG